MPLIACDYIYIRHNFWWHTYEYLIVGKNSTSGYALIFPTSDTQQEWSYELARTLYEVVLNWLFEVTLEPLDLGLGELKHKQKTDGMGTWRFPILRRLDVPTVT